MSTGYSTPKTPGEGLFNTMNLEIGLFSRFSDLLMQLSGSVRDKNWVLLEEILTNLHSIGEKIVETENKRHEEYASFKETRGLSQASPVCDILTMLASEERDVLDCLTRRLRMEIMQVRVSSRGLSYYLASVSHLVKNILEEAFPYTRGTLYSRSGKESPKREGVTMINKEL